MQQARIPEDKLAALLEGLQYFSRVWRCALVNSINLCAQVDFLSLAPANGAPKLNSYFFLQQLLVVMQVLHYQTLSLGNQRPAFKYLPRQ